MQYKQMKMAEALGKQNYTIKETQDFLRFLNRWWKGDTTLKYLIKMYKTESKQIPNKR